MTASPPRPGSSSKALQHGSISLTISSSFLAFGPLDVAMRLVQQYKRVVIWSHPGPGTVNLCTVSCSCHQFAANLHAAIA